MPLTDAACKNAKRDTKPYKLSDGGGLYLEVSPKGGKYWRLKYRFFGKEKRLALGVYPAVPIVEARSLREDAKKQLANNIDPGAIKKENKRKMALSASTTFEVVAREWHEKQKGIWTPDHALHVLHRMEFDIFPQLGNRPVASITPVEVLACLRKIETRGAFELARRGRQTCGQVFRYAIVTGRAERNPAADLSDALKPFKRGHFAAIEADDLPDFLRALERNEARLFMQTRAAVWLLMLTFVRTSELIASRWEEFNLDAGEWLIPAERMKMRRPHIVPLSTKAVTILRELHRVTGRSEWVFPNQVRPNTHMSNCTVLMALKRLGYRGRMTGHGFRALAMSTIKEKLGYRHEVVDRQLAHAPRSQIDAAYDRAMFLSDRRKMMQDWADYLTTLNTNGA